MTQAEEKKRVLDGMNPGVHPAMVVTAMGRWIAGVPNRTDETDQVIHKSYVTHAVMANMLAGNSGNCINRWHQNWTRKAR
jgi:hypothetical protein